MSSSFLRTAFVLGLLSAIGPFAIDMYLPALPTIAADLRVGTASVQMSLQIFFVAVAAGQLVVGPLSDMYGRKAPLYAGLVLFALGSVGAALAPTIEWLIAFRFVQGIGACAGMVVPRAIVRDLHTGTDAAKLMALLMLVFSVSPILAPLTGSLVIELFGWRAVFVVVAVAALLAIAMAFFALAETRPAEKRAGSTISGALGSYAFLLRDRYFLGVCFMGGFGVASFFTYLATSSFVLIEHYGLTPTLYGVFFAVNAIAFIGSSQFTSVLAQRFGMKRVVRVAVTGYAATMLTLFAIFAAGVDRLDVLAALLFVGYGFLGLVVPASSVLALDDHGARAGTASALMGTLHLLSGVVAIMVVSLFFNNTPLPMVAGIAGCSVISFVLAQITLRGRPSPLAAEAAAE